jgi:D-glycero-alpha-D-manno-heptose-7-phosphate kinase
VNLFLASEIPPGTGLGSSATVCVNLLKALSTYMRKPISKYELAERAFHIAHNILGKPVGKQDEYAAAFGGLNFITIATSGTTSVEPLNIPAGVKRELQQNLMLFFTGVAHDSWSILRAQEASSTKEHGVESLHQIRELAHKMRRALITGELTNFGQFMDEAWQAKKSLSGRISTPLIDELYAKAKANGALGGKITGAGGGGFLLLYCEKPNQPAVREVFGQSNIPELRFEFESDGAQVVVNDPFLDRDGTAGLRWTFALHDLYRANRPVVPRR